MNDAIFRKPAKNARKCGFGATCQNTAQDTKNQESAPKTQANSTNSQNNKQYHAPSKLLLSPQDARALYRRILQRYQDSIREDLENGIYSKEDSTVEHGKIAALGCLLEFCNVSPFIMRWILDEISPALFVGFCRELDVLENLHRELFREG